MNNFQISDNLLFPGWESRDTLDSVVEGFQIISFDWRYLYVNNSVEKQGGIPKSELLGFTMMEKFPGIENTNLFAEMRHCMSDRKARHLENEFTLPDQTKKCFELTIEAIDEGICIISLDITLKKQTEAKLQQINHLYSFAQQVSQKILRVKSESELFDNACHLAIEYGKFKMAWIGLSDAASKTIRLACHQGIPSEDLDKFENIPYEARGPQDHVLRTGSNYVCNDIENTPELERWKSFSSKHNILSYIILPIRKFGIIVGTMNLYSDIHHFSDTQEIELLTGLANDISFALELFEKAKIHSETEKLLAKNEMLFRNTLESMLEGAQIHDFNWEYTYVNDAAVSSSPYLREELIGFTLMEKYPGIEQTDLFKSMERCMNTRQSQHLETDFVYPDGTVRHFELSIQPIPEGIFMLSVDRTEQHKANEKVHKVKRLYAFNSAINQSIVQLADEKVLLQNACRVATEIGEFKMAWVGMFDLETKTIELAHQSGIPDAELPHFRNSSFSKIGPTSRVLRSGSYYNCSDIKTDPLLKSWRPFAARHGIQSGIVLPIRKGGIVIGTFNLYSTKLNFADEAEIGLLKEVTDDISFALDIFEITKKQKETEALVVANEQRFRALIEKSPDMKTLADAKGNIIYGSPSLTATLGRPEAEYLNKPIQQYIHPDYLAAYITKRNSIFQAPGKFFQFKMPLLHSNGNYIMCQGTVTNMLNEPGVNAFVANFRDISKNEAAERKLQEINERLSFLVENSPLGFITWDNQLKVKTWSKQAETIFGWTEKELVESGSNGYLTVYEEDQSIAFKVIADLVKGKAISNRVQHRNYTKDGKIIWCEWFNSAMMDSNGNVIAIMSLVQDITQQKVTEQQLKKSEAFSRAVLNSLSAHIAVINYKGDITTVNESWKQFARENGGVELLTSHEQKNYFKVCEKSYKSGDEVALEVINGLREILDEKRHEYSLEYPCHSPEEERWFALLATKVNSDEPLVVVAHQNISQRKIAEERLHRNIEELEKTNFELDRFVYSVSHDLRSPLTAILGLTTFIEEETKETDTLEHVKMIKGRIMRLDEFIKNILNYSRNNRIGLQIKKIEVQKEISDIVAMLCSAKNTEGINFEINIDEQQPFYSDTQSLNTVLENLISNAIKFRKPNHLENSVRITGVSDDEFLTLSISDNGIGIPPEHHQKIFDMFYRLSGEVDGSGIGLYIAKEIVEKLKGTIHIESEKDKGTIFHLKLKNLHHDYEYTAQV